MFRNEKYIFMSSPKIIIWILLAGIAFTSCVSYKELTAKAKYFSSINDSTLNSIAVDFEPVFQKGDILSIAVITPNQKSSILFNQPNFSMEQGNKADNVGLGSNTPGGYLIDEFGNITFPYLGRIKAAGLTRMNLTDTISQKLKLYVDSAIVSIRLQNYRVTVLGEVTRPGTFSIPSERVTVLDAIGLAGDLTVYGKRNNIRVIRTNDGVRQTATLDLNSGDIFNSPFFFLRQNDIVYIEMNDRKIPNTDQASLRQFSLALGIITALGVIVSAINVFK